MLCRDGMMRDTEPLQTTQESWPESTFLRGQRTPTEKCYEVLASFVWGELVFQLKGVGERQIMYMITMFYATQGHMVRS